MLDVFSLPSGIRMNVLVISIFPPVPMPEADHIYHLSTSLADAGHEIHVLCQRGAIVSDHPRLHTHALIPNWGWKEMLILARLLLKLRPDGVLLNYVGHAYQRRPMLTFAASLTRRILPETRFVTQISYPLGAETRRGLFGRFHKTILKLHGPRASSEFGTLLRDSDQIICLSERHLPVLERHFPGVRAKVVLVPPALIMPLAPLDALSRRETRAALSVHEDIFMFAYMGYLYPTKGVETLLEAFYLLCQRNKRVRLLLVGGGNESQDPNNSYVAGLKQLIVQRHLSESVQFTGGFSWDSDQGSRYLRAADAAVLPFDQGVSLNNSSFAAVVTHELPTVTTCGDVLEALIIHGRNALLCPPQDPEAMMLAMEMLAADASLRTDLRAGARDLARTCFSWPSATHKVICCLAGTGMTGQR